MHNQPIETSPHESRPDFGGTLHEAHGFWEKLAHKISSQHRSAPDQSENRMSTTGSTNQRLFCDSLSAILAGKIVGAEDGIACLSPSSTARGPRLKNHPPCLALLQAIALGSQRASLARAVHEHRIGP